MGKPSAGPLYLHIGVGAVKKKGPKRILATVIPEGGAEGDSHIALLTQAFKVEEGLKAEMLRQKLEYENG